MRGFNPDPCRGTLICEDVSSVFPKIRDGQLSYPRYRICIRPRLQPCRPKTKFTWALAPAALGRDQTPDATKNRHRRTLNQSSLDWILCNLFLNASNRLCVINPHLGESPFPNRRPESQLLSCTKCESAFDELHS